MRYERDGELVNIRQIGNVYHKFASLLLHALAHTFEHLFLLLWNTSSIIMKLSCV